MADIQATDSDSMAMPPPPAKRQLRPTASLPTTAEIYSEKHGIAPDLLIQLQNVGRRGRQNVAMGPSTQRTFDRTRSVPSHILGGSGALPNGGFSTALDAYAHAQGIINKEAMRAKEVQPFYSTSNGNVEDNLSLSPRGGGGARRKLKFGKDGEVEEEWDGIASNSKSKGRTKGEESKFNAARKRRSSPAEALEGEGEGSDTETETDDVDLEHTATAFSSGSSDFPPVFKTPSLTHPELFAPQPKQTNTHTHQLGASGTRQFRGLPGRKVGFGKTMSAPVGRLGGSSWGDMDVDEGDEDGFDVKEWAESENF